MATHATKETLDAVINTLCEPTNSVLNFHLGGIFVTPARFKGVADAIKAGKISVEIGGTGGFSAFYQSSGNTLTLGSTDLSTDSKRALVIHECTHAICDLQGIRFRAVNGEAAAYTAQALYFRMHGHAADRLVASDVKTDAVFAAAFDVADWFLRLKRGEIGKLVTTLRQAILGTALYGGIKGVIRNGDG
jgi:hypothetical protein